VNEIKNTTKRIAHSSTQPTRLVNAKAGGTTSSEGLSAI